MNERIIDIAMEANGQTGNQFDLNYKPLDSFLEKFAELILEEVMQELFINGYEDAFDFLNEHFGVKE